MKKVHQIEVSCATWLDDVGSRAGVRDALGTEAAGLALGISLVEVAVTTVENVDPSVELGDPTDKD